MNHLETAGNLTVVTGLDQIEGVFLDMLNTQLPGFQIAPGVDPDASLAELERSMQTYVDPAFCFDTVEERQNSNRDSGPHIDDTLAKYRLGIARHLSKAGSGLVALQLISPEVAETHLVKPEHLVGPVLGGELSPGMQTIMSEGIVAATGAVLLGPTLHDYVTIGARRTCQRDSYSGE